MERLLKWLLFYGLVFSFDVNSNSIISEHTAQNFLTPSFAANYLSEKDLIARFKNGYSEKLDADSQRDLYSRLIKKGYHKDKIATWISNGWLKQTVYKDAIIFELDNKEYDAALQTAQSVDLSNYENIDKLEMLLRFMESGNTSLIESFVKELRVQNFSETDRSNEKVDRLRIFNAWIKFQSSENFTLEYLNMAKEAFLNNPELIQPFPYTNAFISKQATSVWYQLHGNQLDVKLVLNSEYVEFESQLLKNLFDLGHIKLEQHELEMVEKNIKVLSQTKPETDLVIDGKPYEELNNIVQNLELFVPYSEKQISMIDINALNESSRLHLLEWAMSVDHQYLVRNLVTNYNIPLHEAKVKPIVFFEITAAPLEWYYAFMPKVLEDAAKLGLINGCNDKVNKYMYLLEYIYIGGLNKNELLCFFSRTSDKNLLSKIWNTINNLSEDEQLDALVDIIDKHPNVLRSLFSDGFIDIDKSKFLIIFDEELKKNGYFLEKLSFFEAFGLESDRFESLIKQQLENTDYIKIFLSDNNASHDFFIREPWFQDKLCAFFITKSYGRELERAKYLLVKNNVSCSITSINMIQEDEEINWDYLLDDGSLFSHQAKIAFLFESIESEDFSYFTDYIESHGVSVLSLENTKGIELSEVLEEKVKSLGWASTLFKSILTEYKSEASPKYSNSATPARLQTALKNKNLHKFKRELFSYPYSEAIIENLINNLSLDFLTAEYLSFRHSVIKIISSHPSFANYQNNWALYRKIFPDGEDGGSAELLKTYKKLGFNLSELRFLPKKSYFSCPTLIRYLDNGLPKDITDIKGKTLFEKVIDKDLTIECVEALKSMGVNTKGLFKGQSIYLEFLLQFKGNRAVDIEEITNIFKMFKRLGYKVKSDVATNNRIIRASLSYDKNVLEYLLNNGIDINDSIDPDYPLIAHIIRSFRLDLFKVAVEHGARFDVRYQSEPLLFFAINQSPEISQWMIKNGYPVCVKNSKGKSVYQTVYNSKSKEMLKLYGDNKCN
ncbi:hypothetical protein PMAN_b0288 [Pseudoalteromonas marina]|uniref:ankyrin repeat domain-containing protein n=1 Tax=Pseudoalteromonas marina TaxID=267375 RepID=UPI00026D1281|nr:ankyrin repeat domain-containing protein [Pseudoalteromonas marina]KAF7772695.1 hypothetical protein PMAN_b0288 [Pseudoalteromonas marina]